MKHYNYAHAVHRLWMVVCGCSLIARTALCPRQCCHVVTTRHTIAVLATFVRRLYLDISGSGGSGGSRAELRTGQTGQLPRAQLFGGPPRSS